MPGSTPFDSWHCWVQATHSRPRYFGFGPTSLGPGVGQPFLFGVDAGAGTNDPTGIVSGTARGAGFRRFRVCTE